MALATQCPHCKTTFRVAQDQLKLRGGIVRCGACHEIFDGNASLVDRDALADAASPEPVSQVPALAAGAGELAPAGVDEAHAGSDAHPAHFAMVEPAGAAPHAEDVTAQATAEAPTPEEDEPVVIEDTPVAEASQAAQDEPGAIEEALLAEATEAEQEEPVIIEDTPVADAIEPALHEPVAIDAAADLPEPGPAASEPRPVFSMGSALLAEPGHGRALNDGRIEPTLAPPAVDEELVASALPHDHGHYHDDTEADLHAQAERMARAAAEHAPLPLRESSDEAPAAPPPARPARSRTNGRRSKLTPTRIAPPKLRVPEIDEPEFVKRGRQREESGKRLQIAMAAGSVLLALLLAAQAAAAFRNELAARFPAMKPALSSLCTLMRCRVELPARIENLTIETGDLQTLGADTYVLSTLLHNQDGLVQAWPDIELALTDANDKPLVRRVFAPADYLPPGASTAGFGAHAEQPVKLYFRLDQLKPSGYHIAVFYP